MNRYAVSVTLFERIGREDSESGRQSTAHNVIDCASYEDARKVAEMLSAHGFDDNEPRRDCSVCVYVYATRGKRALVNVLDVASVAANLSRNAKGDVI